MHYENICDLLEESIEYVNDRFFVYMKSESQGDVIKNNNCTLDELMFVTPKYLIPYLKYIKANRRLFRTIIQNSGILKSEETYKKMFKNIFDPVMGRFHFAQQEREYILTFYLHGLIAIVTRWLENDCSDPIEQIIEIMHKCVMAGRNNLENFVVNKD